MYEPVWIGCNKNGPILERAWWTAMIGSSVEPDGPTSEKLIWQASAPKTPNEETEYTSGNEFEVGFTGSKEEAEIEASYRVSNEKTEKIPDWGVENKTSGNVLSWLFSARHRCDMRPHHYNDEQCFDGCARRARGAKDIGPKRSGYSIDTAVVPIPIEAVTMTPNPANARKTRK